MKFLFMLVSSVAVAATSLFTPAEVNQKIVELLAPLNNQNTALSVAFTDLNVSETRALDFNVDAKLSKIGTQNKLFLNLKNASYHYNNGVNPTVSGELSAQFDLVKAFGQEALNSVSGELENITKNFISEYGKKYGEAATLDVGVDELQKDENGNVTAARMHMSVTLDYAKLPAELKVEDVEIQSLSVALGANRGGFAGQVVMVLNPLNKNFNADQPGLKEYIEKLLNGDKDTFDMIQSTAALVDSFAAWLVEYNPNGGHDGQTQE